MIRHARLLLVALTTLTASTAGQTNFNLDLAPGSFSATVPGATDFEVNEHLCIGSTDVFVLSFDAITAFVGDNGTFPFPPVVTPLALQGRTHVAMTTPATFCPTRLISQSFNIQGFEDVTPIGPTVVGDHFFELGAVQPGLVGFPTDMIITSLGAGLPEFLVVATGPAPADLHLYEGDGTTVSTFNSTPTVVPTPGDVYTCLGTLGDDLLAGDPVLNELHRFEDAGGGYAFTQDIALPATPISILGIDVAGIPTAFVVVQDPATLDGTLLAYQEDGVGLYVQVGQVDLGVVNPGGFRPGLVTMDFEGDGDQDLAIGAGDAGILLVPQRQIGISLWPVIPAGVASSNLRVGDLDMDGIDELVSLDFGPSELASWDVTTDFLRGDVTGDGTINLSDGIQIANYASGLAVELACEDAADANDDGTISIADALYVLQFLFGTPAGPGPPPPAPFPAAGADPTPDSLGC